MNNPFDNKVLFPLPVDEDEILSQMLDSPKQRARREELRKMDRADRILHQFLYSAACFSAGVIFLWLLLLL